MATNTFSIVITIALLILGICLTIAPLKIWSHLAKLRRESLAAAEQSYKNSYVLDRDLKAILASLTALSNSIDALTSSLYSDSDPSSDQ